MKKYQSDDIG